MKSEKAEKKDDTDKADKADTEAGQKEAIKRQRAKSLSSLVFQSKE